MTFDQRSKIQIHHLIVMYIEFLLHGCLNIGFFVPKISKIVLVLEYDLLDAIYWPPNDL